jgi:DamX protein
MNKYIEWLNLDFDPFAPSVTSRDFYCSGNRQQILDQIVELSLYSNAMIAVTGPLGAGKTTLAANFCDRFADEAVCVKIAATLFMNQNQFLESLQDSLGFNTAGYSGIDAGVEQICHYAAELDLEARSLILIIDDAHELSAEVLQLLTKLLGNSVDSSIHALLLGENQLDSLLQGALSDDAQERLAVFSLDGFASEETHEYIRFKLATARFTNELPLSGGVVGAIHNSSQGMPGAINSLVADALNSAAPAAEPDEFANLEPIFSGERIEQLDEFEDLGADEAQERYRQTERDSAEQSWIPNIQPKYWAAAAALVLLLAGTLVFWDASPPTAELESIPVAVTATTSAAFDTEPAALITEPEAVELEADLPEVDVVAVEEQINEVPVVANVVAAVEANSEPAVEDTEPAATVSEVKPVVEEVAKVSPTIASASPFVERLLQTAPENFAVQLLASHSEANIRDFVAKLSGDHPAGYFETRYQSKPWFVAVLAAYDDRDQASRAISALPLELRSNEPWIRSVAGIQTDIRELLGAQLVSAK